MCLQSNAFQCCFVIDVFFELWIYIVICTLRLINHFRVRVRVRVRVDSMQNSTDVDRRTLYVSGWTPLAEPRICKNILQISPRANNQFQIRKVQ